MKKKILFVYHHMIIGGSTTSLLSILKAIDYDRYDVDLLLYRNEGELIKYIPEEVNLLPQAAVEWNKKQKLLYSFINGSMIKAIFMSIMAGKGIKPDEQLMAYVCATLCRKIKTKYDVAVGFLEGWSDIFVNNYIKAAKKINWIHTDYEKCGFIADFDSKCYEKAENIVCVVEESMEAFNRSFPTLSEKVITIRNILSQEVVLKRAGEEVEFNKNDSFNILTVCRVDNKSKALDRGVKALKKLKEDGYNVKWYILGDGPDREKLELMIKEYGLEKDFILLGSTQNPYPYFKYFDIFALPSRFEGKPMAITEAQMLGLVPVVTEYASANEQIENEKTGIVVENKDEAIYDGIKKVLDNPQLLESIRKNLKETNFSNEEVIEDIYRRL